MIALFLLVLSLLFGFSLLRLCKTSFFVFETISMAFILGATGLTWVCFLCVALLGYTFGIPLAIGIVTALSLVSLARPRLPISFPRFSKIGIATYVLHTLFWSGLFLFVLTTHMLERKGEGIYSGGNTWGDLALHATFVNKFAQQPTINLTSPIYAQKQTTYPFLYDFYTSLLFRYGFSLQGALVISSLLFLCAFFQLIYFFVWRLFKSHGASFLFPFTFLLNGGLGFVYFFSDWKESGKSFLDFFFSMPIGYANLFVHHIYWSNMIADYLLPQRSFIAALGLFTCFLYFLYTLYKGTKNTLSHILVICFILASLPFFHVHTFLVCSGILTWFLLVQALKNSRSILSWLIPGLVTLLLVAPQLYWQFSHTFGQGFTRLQVGWMAAGDNWILFWIHNMGLEFIFFIFGGIYLLLRRKQQPFLFQLFVPIVFAFILTNLVVFQPYDYDNTKFMVYIHFVFCLLIAYIFSKILRRRLIALFVLPPLFLLLIAAGSLSTIRETYLSWQIASESDMQIAQVIEQKTSPYAIFLTSDNHNHPVTMLAGRSILMGYRGWLWTHGISYTATERDIMSMFRGDEQTPTLLAKYNVSYVFIGSSERANFYANEDYFATHYNVLFKNASGTVYDVQTSAPTVAQQ